MNIYIHIYVCVCVEGGRKLYYIYIYIYIYMYVCIYVCVLRGDENYIRNHNNKCRFREGART